MTTNIEVMTKLYKLTSVIDDWPHRGARYNNVGVTWFVCERDYDPDFDYVTLLDRPVPPGDESYYVQGLVDELFTRYEADQLAEYLRKAHGTDVDIAEVSAPINVGYLDSEGDWVTYMPVGAIPVGGDCDFYTLSEHDDYDLPFRAWGYYIIDTGADMTWRELHPNGRHIYYEGDDPEGFAAEIRAEFGFDPSDDPLWGGPAIMLGPDGEHWSDPFGRIHYFHCPPEHLDAIYGSDRWPMGS